MLLLFSSTSGLNLLRFLFVPVSTFSPISAPAPVKAPLQLDPDPNSPFPPMSQGDALAPGTDPPGVSR